MTARHWTAPEKSSASVVTKGFREIERGPREAPIGKDPEGARSPTSTRQQYFTSGLPRESQCPKVALYKRVVSRRHSYL